ncbi:MAG: lanthionine synthetase LanC family protein, partial [Nitrospirota bacterium]
WPYIEGEKFAFVAVTEYGVSGIGAFLLSMYKNTNDKEAEKYAKGAAEWLKAIALSVDSKEKPCYKWRAGHGDIPKDAWTRARYFHTGWCWGAAGVCWFLYKMYEEFGDSSYLEYANGGMNWLKSIAIPEAGGYKWYRSDYEEDINQYHTTWGKGAAGIGYVFLLGYQITGDPSYLEYAKKAGEWLTSQAIPSGNGGYKWPSDKPYFPNTWCDGSCIPVALFFAELYKEIRIERYLEYVMGAYNWINTIKVTGSSGGYTWYINEELNNLGDISENGGTASMIRHIGRICNQPTLEEFADKAAIWIINQKEVDGDGYKWIKRVEIKQVKIDEIFSKTPILLKSYPNPFINSCQISAFSGQVSAFSLQIYDIKG